MNWNNPLPYFTEKELACPESGRIVLDQSFAAHFPYLRHRWGQPLYPNSVCRSRAHNDEIDGHPRSLHMIDNPTHPTAGSMAADIQWRDWPDRMKLLFARMCWILGWSVGLHDGFIHIDRRVDIGLEQAIFTYDEWSQPFTPDEVRS